MLLLVVLMLPALAHGDDAVTTAPRTLSVRVDASSIAYRLIHKLHKVDGSSRRIEGRARIQAAGLAQVAVRVPIESFDSGNVNRDAHMKEATEAARFPYVELKATVDGLRVPTTFPTQIERTWRVQLTFHGVSQQLEVPVTLLFEAPDRVTATSSFAISLDAFKIERPSLMFVKVDDALRIDASLTFGP